MIVDAGNLAMVVALLVSVYGVLGSFLGGWRRSPALVDSSRYSLYSVPVLLLISVYALVYAFVTKDFSVAYVVENSNLAMPDRYT